VALEIDGVLNPPDAHSAPDAVTTISNNRFWVHTANGGVLLEGTFELDASIRPKIVNWTDSIGPDVGKTLPAIYALDGDSFKFIAGYADAPRPKAFKTEPGQTMRTFIRLR
jgi:uncharacterized protein (TIGR03067 family)